MIDEATSPGHSIRLEDADRRWVENVLACRWVTPDGGTAVTPSLCGQNEIAIGSYRTTLEAVIAARPNAPGGVALEFCPTHDGWKILPLKLYRPLVYYAAFGSDDIFGCLRAAIVSLLAFGQWRHSIVILTRSEDLPKVDAVVADLNLGPRLHIVTVPGADILDWCLARYRTNVAETFATHQPILYLDVDVLCDGPLDDLCLKLVHSRTVEVLSEGRLDEGETNSHGHWFGWRLMAADDVTFNPLEPGFSSGVLGFANKSVVEQAFSAVLRSAYCYAQKVGTRHHFAGYDQPFCLLRHEEVRLGITRCTADHRAPLPGRSGHATTSDPGRPKGPRPFQWNCWGRTVKTASDGALLVRLGFPEEMIAPIGEIKATSRVLDL